MSSYLTVRVLFAFGLSVTAMASISAMTQSAAIPRAADQPSPDEKSFADELRAGETALERRQFFSVLDVFSRANALRNKISPEAWFGMARASYGQSVFAESLRSCDRALKFVAGQDLLKAAIVRLRALSLVALAGGPDDPKLQDAAADLQSALALNPQLTDATYYRGAALLASYRDAEGLVELKRYLANARDGAEAEAARRLIDNPRRARERFAAPAFSVTGHDGKTVDSRSLAGKVVVLDFWGTWCPPCRANTPDLVRLHEKYKNQPVVFVGIGVAERSQETWRSYVVEHKMAWLQVLDHGKADEIIQVFRVSGVPDYVVIDSDGIVRPRMDEWGPEGPVALKSSIQKALPTITP